MTDILLSEHHTLHDITDGNPNFTGNVHIQSKQGEFYFANPSQKDLDEGKFNFIPSSGGYVMVNITQPGIGMIALKSQTPNTVRVWSDSISKPKSVTENVGAVTRVATSESSNGSKASVLLWVGVIVILLYVMHNRKK